MKAGKSPYRVLVSSSTSSTTAVELALATFAISGK